MTPYQFLTGDKVHKTFRKARRNYLRAQMEEPWVRIARHTLFCTFVVMFVVFCAWAIISFYAVN